MFFLGPSWPSSATDLNVESCDRRGLLVPTPLRINAATEHSPIADTSSSRQLRLAGVP